MTCIIGLIQDGKAYLGGDSAGVDGCRVSIRKDRKVFSKEVVVLEVIRRGRSDELHPLSTDEMLVGFTSSFRMGQLLAHRFNPPEHKCVKDVVNTYTYMVTEFIEGVRECLKDGGFAHVKDGEESGGTFVVAYQGRLFVVEDDFQVEERLDAFVAVGSGGDIALGSLYSTKGLDPEDRIRMALKAASHFTTDVREPFHILSIEEK